MTRILVIEDDKLILDNVLEVLALEGFDTDGATNGAIGLDRANENRPDIILCDIMMPVMNGYDVLKNLRKTDEMSTIPFIFLTAVADRTSHRQGMELGADDYLTKPFTPDELIAAVGAVLEKRQKIAQDHEKRIEQLRKNMSYALPHELRTPLTGLIGCAELLTLDHKSMDAGQLHQIAGVITDSASRLHRLIENYLYYAKVELLTHDDEQVVQMRQSTTEYPQGVMNEVVTQQMQKAARSEDLQLDMEDAVVSISYEDLYRIVNELIDNALKFSEAGSTVKVTAKASADGQFVITVTDEGRGMSAEEIASIGAYMQFNRLLHEQQGLGLGLAIVQRLVAIYNGSFDVESEPEQYTTVKVSLPLAPETVEATAVQKA